jgi:hypothetical protein
MSILRQSEAAPLPEDKPESKGTGVTRRKFLGLSTTMVGGALTPGWAARIAGIFAPRSSIKQSEALPSQELKEPPPHMIQVGDEIASFDLKDIPTLSEFLQFSEVYKDWFQDLNIAPETVYASFRTWAEIAFQSVQELQRFQLRMFEGSDQPSMLLLTSAVLLAHEIKNIAQQHGKTKNTDSYLADYPLRALFRNTVLNARRVSNSERVNDFHKNPPEIVPGDDPPIFDFKNPEYRRKIQQMTTTFQKLPSVPEQYWKVIEHMSADDMMKRFLVRWNADHLRKTYSVFFTLSPAEQKTLEGNLTAFFTYLKELKPKDVSDLHLQARKFAVQLSILYSFIGNNPQLEFPPDVQDWVNNMILEVSLPITLPVSNTTIISSKLGQINPKQEIIFARNNIHPAGPHLAEMTLDQVLFLLSDDSNAYDSGSLRRLSREAIQAMLLPAITQGGADLKRLIIGEGPHSTLPSANIPFNPGSRDKIPPIENHFPPSNIVGATDETSWVEVLFHELLHSQVDISDSQHPAVLGLVSTIDATLLYSMKLHFITSLFAQAAQLPVDDEGVIPYFNVPGSANALTSSVETYKRIISLRDKSKNLRSDGFSLPPQVPLNLIQEMQFHFKNEFWDFFHVLQGIYKRYVNLGVDQNRQPSPVPGTDISAFIGDGDTNLEIKELNGTDVSKYREISEIVKILYFFTVRIFQTGLPVDTSAVQ